VARAYAKLVHLWVHLVVGPGQHDLARLREAAEVVNVAVDHGVVAADATPQPDDLLQTQRRLPDTPRNSYE